MISVDLPATRTFTSNNARAIATELGIDLGALGRDLQRPLRRPDPPGPRPFGPCGSTWALPH
jgi:hypothetical protein